MIARLKAPGPTRRNLSKFHIFARLSLITAAVHDLDIISSLTGIVIIVILNGQKQNKNIREYTVDCFVWDHGGLLVKLLDYQSEEYSISQ